MRRSPRGQVLLREPWPPVAGVPGLAQGRYGSAGNLELVAPAVDEGIWVGWFNSDPTERYAGAALGRWSGALRFAAGHSYASARIAQVDPGPDWLEVVALTTDGTLRRHVWSPDDGFVDHGPVTLRAASSSAILPDPADGSLLLAVAGSDGTARLLRAEPGAAYPALDFVEVGVVPGSDVRSVDAGWHGDHLDLLTVAAGGAVTLDCGGQSVRVAVGATSAALAVGPRGYRRVVTTGRSGATLLAVDPPTEPTRQSGSAGPQPPRWLRCTGPAARSGTSSAGRATGWCTAGGPNRPARICRRAGGWRRRCGRTRAVGAPTEADFLRPLSLVAGIF